VITTTNKRLLISESYGDLNRCTPCRGKPDQYATRFPRLVHVWSRTIRISRGPHIATFHGVINRVEQGHCSWEKGLSVQSPARQPIDPWVCTQFFSWANHWRSGGKVNHLLTAATKLTGPINTNMRSVCSILVRGANPLVLNWLRQGLQRWRCRLSMYHSLTFPTGGLHFPPKGPARSPV
jgi:hypothetical protein